MKLAFPNLLCTQVMGVKQMKNRFYIWTGLRRQTCRFCSDWKVFCLCTASPRMNSWSVGRDSASYNAQTPRNPFKKMSPFPSSSLKPALKGSLSPQILMCFTHLIKITGQTAALVCTFVESPNMLLLNPCVKRPDCCWSGLPTTLPWNVIDLDAAEGCGIQS